MKIKRIEIGEAEALLGRVKDSTLIQDDYELIKEFVDTLILLDQALTEKNSSIKRLLKMIFGHKTEKTKDIKTGPKKKKDNRKNKVKGHGKKGADDYKGAEKIKVPHSTLQHCDPCPACRSTSHASSSSPTATISPDRTQRAPPKEWCCALG